MKVRERRDDRLVLEAFSWDIALVTGGLFVGPLVFAVIGLLSGGDLLIIPLLVSALAAFLFAMFVGRRIIIFDAGEDRIELKFQSLLRKKSDLRKLGDLKGVKLTGSIGEDEPVELDPNSLPERQYRLAAVLEFVDSTELVIAGATKIASSAPEIVRTVEDWLRNSR